MISIKSNLKGVLKNLKLQKIDRRWGLNAAFILIVTLSVSLVGYVSFSIISDAMISHARKDSMELIKQITRNIEVIMTGFDDITTGILRDDGFNECIRIHDSLTDDHKKADNGRKIEGVLSNRARTRTDIADIAVVTNKGEYLTSGAARPSTTDDTLSYYVVRMFFHSGKDSLWLDTYWTDVGSTGTFTGGFRVISNVKSIKGVENKSSGMLVLNIRESYLYNLMSDIKLPHNGQIFIVGKRANYVMNPSDRSLNGTTIFGAEYKSYLEEILKQKNGSTIKTIRGKDYLLIYNTIDEINGTELGWTIFTMTPVNIITSSVKDAVTHLLLIGLICIAAGFLISLLIIKIYNTYLDKKYSEKHAIVMGRERLASLGQLIGGIAHNFKTPIMSIAGGLEALEDLVNEYDSSIDDKGVTEEDHHEIAKEMKSWVDNIKPYCSYMSDIISTVKGQAVNFNESANVSFTVEELLRRVKILLNHELKRNHCEMIVDLKVSGSTCIKGELNNLVQVMNNMISNAIESYNGQDGKIDVAIDKIGHNIKIIIRDYGCGMPKDVKNKLLKQMITTKGKNGTGLGVYMSYSTIKGKFSGTMSIDSEEGKGTTVNINIPL